MTHFKSVTLIIAVLISLTLTSLLPASSLRNDAACEKRAQIVPADTTVVDSTKVIPDCTDHGWDDIEAIIVDVLLLLGTSSGHIITGP